MAESMPAGWTAADILILLEKVQQWPIVMVNDPALGIPAVQDFPAESLSWWNAHGVFEVNMPECQALFYLAPLASEGKFWTHVDVLEGTIPYEKAAVLARLNHLAGRLAGGCQAAPLFDDAPDPPVDEIPSEEVDVSFDLDLEDEQPDPLELRISPPGVALAASEIVGVEPVADQLSGMQISGFPEAEIAGNPDGARIAPELQIVPPDNEGGEGDGLAVSLVDETPVCASIDDKKPDTSPGGTRSRGVVVQLAYEEERFRVLARGDVVTAIATTREETPDAWKLYLTENFLGVLDPTTGKQMCACNLFYLAESFGRAYGVRVEILNAPGLPFAVPVGQLA